MDFLILEEVAWVDPLDPVSVAEGLERALAHEGFEKRRLEGIKIARSLTWSVTAAQTLDVYRELLKSHPEEPSLHYNLGNAYFRQPDPGSLGRAVASYLRAFALDPRDVDIRHNLKLALNNAGEDWAPSGTPPALFMLFHILSRTELAALHWMFYWLLLLGASAYLLREPWRGRLRLPLAGAGACWLFFGSWWGLRCAAALERPAVIVVHQAEVRSGPGLNFPVSFKTPVGRRVSQLEFRNGWIEIGIPKEGLKGWVDTDSVESL